MSQTLHSFVLAQLSQAQVRSTREAKRLGADQPMLQSIMFAVLVDMLVANTLSAGHGKPDADVQKLVESVVKRFRTVLRQARAEQALNDPNKIIVPDQLPPELS